MAPAAAAVQIASLPVRVEMRCALCCHRGKRIALIRDLSEA
jgi:hypothetical protein